MADKFAEAFDSIAHYNGYEEWLWEMADKLDGLDENESLACQVPTEEWHTDKHALWMMLVSAFGEWGTSIRSGWIDKPKDAARFINEATDRYGEWRQHDG